MRKSRGVTTYSGAHRNTTIVRGHASEYACACGGLADEWALKHEAPGLTTNALGQSFSVDPFDYSPMCRRCHRLYDKAKITHCPQGHAYEGDNLLMDAGKRKCRTCHYGRITARRRERLIDPEQRERKNEYQRQYRARLKAAGS